MPRILTIAAVVTIQPKVLFSSHGCHYIFCHFCSRRRESKKSTWPSNQHLLESHRCAKKKSSRRCRKPRGSRLDSHHLPAEKSKSLVDLFGGSNFNELGWIAGSIKHRNPLFYEKRWMAGTGGWGGRLRIKRKKLGLKWAAIYRLDKELPSVVQVQK